MANRDVTVRLRAEIGNFEAAMKRASAVTQEVATKGQGAFDKLAQKQREHEQAWSTLSTGAVVAGGAMVAAVGSIVSKYASFDKAMSAVQASTHASGVEMEKLRELAMRAGADTAYSGEEAAAGINELAKAGVSTNDILRGGLNGALSLAAAGQLEVGDAAELAATAMTQFKLEGKDLGHVADLLAAGAGKAQGSVGDLGYALKQSGLVASQAGISIEETVGTLAAFASAGLVGSDAGTSFKVMLQKLQNPSKEAQAALDELGISMYDSQGNFVGMTSLADQLKTSMENLTPAQRDAAMATIFGSDAVRAANVLYAQGGAGIQDWINKVNDAGYAAETAAALQDNLAGDLEKLGGAFDTLALQSGGSLNDMFRDIVQGATSFLDLVGQIPGPVLTTTTAIVGLGGAGLLTVGGIMKGVAAVAEFKDAADALGLSLPSLDGKMGKLAGTTVAVGAAFTALAIAGELAGSGIEQLGDAAEYATALKILETDAEAGVRRLNELSSASGSAGTSVNGLGDALETVNMNGFMKGLDFVGSGFGAFDSDVKLAEEALKNFDAALATTASTSLESAAKGFQEFKTQAENSGMSLEQAAAAVPGYANALRDLAAEHGLVLEGEELYQAMLGNLPPKLLEAQAAADGAGAGIEGMGGALEGMGAAAEEAQIPLDELVDALKLLGDIHISETQAMQDYNNSLVELQNGLAATGAWLDETGTRFDTHTEAGQKANGMIISLREDMWSLVEAQAANDASQETLQATMAGTYQAMLDSMTAMGLTTEQADILTRAVLGVPEGVSIDSWMSDKAYQMANETTSAVEGVPDDHHTTSSMDSNARDMANQTQSAIRNIERDVKVTITTTRHEVIQKSALGRHEIGHFGGPLRYTGGFPTSGAFPIRGFATGGGLLPGVPPSNPYQDNLAGMVVDTGEPVMLRSREFIVNEPGVWRGANLEWLRWMNAGGTMSTPPRGFAVGGSPAALPAPSVASAPSSSGVDSAAIAGAVRAGLAGADFRFSIGGREFKAAIQDVNRQYGRP